MKPRVLKIFLFILVLPYSMVIWIRNFLFNIDALKSQKFSIPTISVGNLSVGGTGKTPHIEYLINYLKKDFNVAVLSRGYLRKTKGFLIADQNSTALDIGDEPAQLKSKFPDIIVAVDSNRANGIKSIAKAKPETDLILLDDAFQHRWIEPGVNILLSDFNKPYYKDHLMPAGRLREHRHNSRRADIILITRTPGDISAIDRRIMVGEANIKSHQHLYFTSVVYKEAYSLFDNNIRPLVLSEIIESKKNILLLTGIADTKNIYNYLSIYSKEITHLSFPDHHYYKDKDIRKIIDEYSKMPEGETCIITTEKDAERLKEHKNIGTLPKESTFVLPIGTVFLNNDADEFNNFISNYVKKTKSNSIIS